MRETYTKAYSINEVSKAINVPSGTIRQWEKDLAGLLIIPRTKQGARFYTDTEIALLEKVKQMRDKNLSKDMIRQLLETYLHPYKEMEENQLVPAILDSSEPPSTEVLPIKEVLEQFKQELVQEFQIKLREVIKKEAVEEIRRELSKNSLQMVKSLSDSIYKSTEKTRDDIEVLAELVDDNAQTASKHFKTLHHQVAKVTETASGEIRKLTGTLTEAQKATAKEIQNEVAKVSEAAAGEIRSLSGTFSEASKASARELQTLNQKVAKVTDATTKEIRSLTGTLAKASKASTSELQNLNQKVAKVSEVTSKEISSLNGKLTESAKESREVLKNLKLEVAKVSEYASEEIRSLTGTLAEVSEASSEEFKTLLHHISASAEITTGEFKSLSEIMNQEREIFIDTIHNERELYRQEIQQREEMFQDLVKSFRETAPTKKDKKWWQVWS